MKDELIWGKPGPNMPFEDGRALLKVYLVAGEGFEPPTPRL
jgi:hypothetical protein